jgi:hypothetical protein
MFFSCLLLFGRSKRSKVAVKSERPTKKVKPSALSEGLRITNMVTPSKLVRGAHPTKNQCGITSPSKAKYQQRKLHQTPASESLQKPMQHHLAAKGEIPTMKFTPSAHKRKPTKNQYGDEFPAQREVKSPSRAKDQQKKLNQAP